MINLTLAEVKKAGLKAYEAGELSAQGPAPQYFYRDANNRPCVIGAVLTDEDYNFLVDTEWDQSDILSLHERGLVVFPSKSEARVARKLQHLNDDWTMKVLIKAEAKVLKEAEAALKKALTSD